MDMNGPDASGRTGRSVRMAVDGLTDSFENARGLCGYRFA